MEPDELLIVELFYRGDPKITIECTDCAFEHGFLNIKDAEGNIQGYSLTNLVRYAIAQK